MSKELTAEQRTQRARLAANERWSRQDPVEGTAKARRAAEDRFLDQVDPHRELPEGERQRRAASASKAHFQRMALASAKARQAKAAT